MSEEHRRLDEANQGKEPWRRWGPYLSERQWGTVREDYSPGGEAWDYFPHDHARSRAYRWGEDGLGGFSDDRQILCLGLALWNGKDPILKERLFGLAGPEGNHGEDVKELYFYLDGTPTHSYMRMLYKYPQGTFPYDLLVKENRRRGKGGGEFELYDTGVFAEERYFDVTIEYAKEGPEDILMRVRAVNRGPEEAPLVLMPQLWFRNTWSWEDEGIRPVLRAEGSHVVAASHHELGSLFLHADRPDEMAFCENDTHHRRRSGIEAGPGYFKDGLHDYLVNEDASAVNPAARGTKAGIIWRRVLPPGGEAVVRLRLGRSRLSHPFGHFDRHVDRARKEADAFYRELQADIPEGDRRNVHRQALAGMLWSKQTYRFQVARWLEGDPGQPSPPEGRRAGRNQEWSHLDNADVLSMPDKWEYPWYAAWDLAFHCVPLASVDPAFAKDQLLLLAREWYMHPNGQLPAYEWAFGDVNPPVHAWAAWRVFEIDRAARGDAGDLDFLERMLHKLLLNFTWWVNRKDAHGLNLFQGGFLGLDNIGVFDRSAPLPVQGHLEQADGTSWMAMYSLNLLRISLELAQHRPVYEDIATKFFEHFLYIAGAMRNIGGQGLDLWDEKDGFFYDALHYDSSDGSQCESFPLKIRSLVGLIPLLAVEVLGPELLERVPNFRRRMEWFLENRPDLAALVSRWTHPGVGDSHLLSLLRGHRMKLLLRRMLDEGEFLSPFGIRSLSRHHLEHPFRLELEGAEHTVGYEPGESETGLFGGNSNWRGPIWLPLNFLLIEALRKFHHYYGDGFLVEHPTGSGRKMSLHRIADDLTGRVTSLFLPDAHGRVPSLAHPGLEPLLREGEAHLFHEYFHGENGLGLGASHQTGWTGLVATLVKKSAASTPLPSTPP